MISENQSKNSSNANDNCIVNVFCGMRLEHIKRWPYWKNIRIDAIFCMRNLSFLLTMQQLHYIFGVNYFTLFNRMAFISKKNCSSYRFIEPNKFLDHKTISILLCVKISFFLCYDGLYFIESELANDFCSLGTKVNKSNILLFSTKKLRLKNKTNNTHFNKV